MGLIKSKGNMYTWVTHEWNPVKGKCSHDCSYCFMKRWGTQLPVRLDEKEFKCDLGSGNFIFVVSGSDLFAKDIPEEWIIKTLHHCEQFDNKYLFQSKNPWRILDYIDACVISDKSVVCTTMETNRFYPEVMRNCPPISDRIFAMHEISKVVKTYITIEPIMDFDLDEFIIGLKNCNPTQVNIGADSGKNNLPEPSKEKILALIDALKEFTTIDQKRNLDRLLV